MSSYVVTSSDSATGVELNFVPSEPVVELHQVGWWHPGGVVLYEVEQYKSVPVFVVVVEP